MQEYKLAKFSIGNAWCNPGLPSSNIGDYSSKTYSLEEFIGFFTFQHTQKLHNVYFFLLHASDTKAYKLIFTQWNLPVHVTRLPIFGV